MDIENKPQTSKTPEDRFDEFGKNLESLETRKEKIQAEIDSLQHLFNDATERLHRVSGYIDQTMGVMESLVKDASQPELTKPALSLVPDIAEASNAGQTPESIPEQPVVVDRAPGDIGNSQPAAYIGPDGLVYSSAEEAARAGQAYGEDILTRFS